MATIARRLLRVSLCSVLMAAVAAGSTALTAADAPVKPATNRKPRGRLPAYYTKVVTEQQRDQIYAIQEEYNPKIQSLESQLRELRKERDDKVEAVLTADQQKQVDAAEAKSRARKTSAKQQKLDVAVPTDDKPAPVVPASKK